MLTIGIYKDEPVNINRLLFYDRIKLVRGYSDKIATIQDQAYLSALSFREIVRLEQRKGDEGCWTLTDLGKKVISYLEKNRQVLDKEGSLKQ